MDRVRSLAVALLLAATAGCAAGGAGAPRAEIGATEVAAAFRHDVRDTAGVTHRLGEDLERGRPVALVFWQPWCGSCLAEVPTVVAAHRRFGDELSFFGVVSGPEGAVDEAEVSRAMLETGMTYPSLRDTDLVLTRAFQVTETPTVVIVDPALGVVYRETTAPAEWHGE